MTSFTKICFYCKGEFEASHPLANICSPGCRPRAYTPTARGGGPEPATIKPAPGEVKPAPDEVKPAPAKVEPTPGGVATRCRRCEKALKRDATDERKYCSPACRKAVGRKARRAL